MVPEPPSGDVPFQPDTETVQRIGWTLSALMFLLAIVSAIGEYLGWWNDMGEVGMTVGTLAGFLVGFATFVRGADSGEVLAVHDEVHAVHDAVTDNGEKLEKLNSIDGKLDKLDDLDRVQFELDKQTGVLEDIRGALVDTLGGSPERTSEQSEDV